jgi:hypothetical protein
MPSNLAISYSVACLVNSSTFMPHMLADNLLQDNYFLNIGFIPMSECVEDGGKMISATTTRSKHGSNGTSEQQ